MGSPMSDSPAAPGNEMQQYQARVSEVYAAFTLAALPPYNIDIATNVRERCH